MQNVTMSRSRKAAVVTASALFVVLSAWQVRAHREDWPLSKYDMYSLQQGAYAQRKVLYGVSRGGEFPLVSVGYGVPSQFWFQFSRIERHENKVQKLLAKLAKDYAARRVTDAKLPELVGVKVYKETWKIEPRMEGSDHPKRKVLFHYNTARQEKTRSAKSDAQGAPSTTEATAP